MTPRRYRDSLERATLRTSGVSLKDLEMGTALHDEKKRGLRPTRATNRFHGAPKVDIVIYIKAAKRDPRTKDDVKLNRAKLRLKKVTHAEEALPRPTQPLELVSLALLL